VSDQAAEAVKPSKAAAIPTNPDKVFGPTVPVPEVVKPVRGLFGPKKPRPPKEPVKLSRSDLSEGLAQGYVWLGDFVQARAEQAEAAGGTFPVTASFGRAMKMTAPTSAKLANTGLKKFPPLYNFLAIFFGSSGIKDTAAAVMIPVLVNQMDRDPFTIPRNLPKLKAHMRPILRDMLKAAREEEKIRRELEAMEQELSSSTGRPFTVDHLILVDMMGLPVDVADKILSGVPIQSLIVPEAGSVPPPPPSGPTPEVME
jgi:hypothetical protein